MNQKKLKQTIDNSRIEKQTFSNSESPCHRWQDKPRTPVQENQRF